jgi:hypothetical protein
MPILHANSVIQLPLAKATALAVTTEIVFPVQQAMQASHVTLVIAIITDTQLAHSAHGLPPVLVTAHVLTTLNNLVNVIVDGLVLHATLLHLVLKTVTVMATAMRDSVYATYHFLAPLARLVLTDTMAIPIALVVMPPSAIITEVVTMMVVVLVALCTVELTVINVSLATTTTQPAKLIV